MEEASQRGFESLATICHPALDARVALPSKCSARGTLSPAGDPLPDGAPRGPRRWNPASIARREGQLRQ